MLRLVCAQEGVDEIDISEVPTSYPVRHDTAPALTVTSVDNIPDSVHLHSRSAACDLESHVRFSDD